MDWFRKERIRNIKGNDLQQIITNLCTTYKTRVVLAANGIMPDSNSIVVEVWVNLNSTQHLINVYERDSFSSSEDEF